MQIPICKGLIERCQAGDRDAFRELFEAYRERVYGLAFHFVANEASAKDVAQEVFLKLFASLKEFRGSSSFDTWLYRLVVNCCMDEHRRNKRFLPLDFIRGSKTMRPAQPTEQAYLRAEIARAVQAAVKKLKPKLRVPILLRYVEELSYEEIATVLCCSQGTVASRLNRAHHILARKLGHLAGGDAAG